MRILSFISGALLGMVFMVSADQVQAREAGTGYISLSAGVVFPQDADDDVIRAMVDEDGQPVLGDDGQPVLGVVNVEESYDLGYHIESALGFYMTKDIRFEAAVNWRQYEISDVDDDLLHALSFTTNAYIDFLNVFGLEDMMGMSLTDAHEPYIGVGVGFALWGSKERDSLGSWFLTNAMAGYNYHINDNLAAGISYRFTYSNPERDDDGVEIEQLNHSILVTVTALF